MIAFRLPRALWASACLGVTIAAVLLLSLATRAQADESVPLAEPWKASEVVSDTAALTDTALLAIVPTGDIQPVSYLPLVARDGEATVEPPTAPAPCSPDNRAFEEEMLVLVNIERAKVGVAPLRENASLTCAARWFAKDMATHDLLSHVGSDGSQFWDRMFREGYTGIDRGEVAAVARHTPAEVVADWMASAPHRGILLDPIANEAGLGYGYSATSLYHTGWVIDTGKGH
ncbi:MAG TPA: CAP domain-containing protein [Roseiflexaceae bacterium]|nr:CAP domain-containing protein [Roseiflexaceae bacterium]